MTDAPHAIVYFDIDGTLIDTAHGVDVSDAMRDAFRQLRQNGVLTAINTGRAYGFIPPSIFTLELDAIVAGDGAYVRLHGETLLEKDFAPATIARIITTFRRERLDMLLEGPHQVYWEEPSFRPEITATYHHLFDSAHAVSALPKGAFDPATIRATKLSYLVFDEAQDLRIREALADDVHILVYPDRPLRAGGPPGVSKATGMAVLAERLGPLTTYAFGDSFNDVPMLDAADIAVAMADGSPEALALADVVAPSVRDNRLADVLHQLALLP